MASEAEVDAAAKAIDGLEISNNITKLPHNIAVLCARVALEAAERVRTKPECLEPNEE